MRPTLHSVLGLLALGICACMQSTGVDQSASAGIIVAQTGSTVCQVSRMNIEPPVPNVLVLIDRSGSMAGRDTRNFGKSRWQASIDAVTAVASEFRDSMAFGVISFPSHQAGEACNPGRIDVPIGLGFAPEALQSIPNPVAAGLSPTAATLRAAREALTDCEGCAAGPKYVLLVTDGQPTCPDGPRSFGEVSKDGDGTATESEIRSLRSANIPVFVVGYDIAADEAAVRAMNQYADLGGTGRFYPVESGEALKTDLKQILRSLVSCETHVDPPLDRSRILRVSIDNVALRADEFSYDRGTITLGTACEKLRDGQPHLLGVDIACPPPPTPRLFRVKWNHNLPHRPDVVGGFGWGGSKWDGCTDNPCPILEGQHFAFTTVGGRPADFQCRDPVTNARKEIPRPDDEFPLGPITNDWDCDIRFDLGTYKISWNADLPDVVDGFDFDATHTPDHCAQSPCEVTEGMQFAFTTRAARTGMFRCTEEGTGRKIKNYGSEFHLGVIQSDWRCDIDFEFQVTVRSNALGMLRHSHRPLSTEDWASCQGNPCRMPTRHRYHLWASNGQSVRYVCKDLHEGTERKQEMNGFVIGAIMSDWLCDVTFDPLPVPPAPPPPLEPPPPPPRTFFVVRWRAFYNNTEVFTTSGTIEPGFDGTCLVPGHCLVESGGSVRLSTTELSANIVCSEIGNSKNSWSGNTRAVTVKNVGTNWECKVSTVVPVVY